MPGARGSQARVLNSWNWIYGWLWVTIWVLETGHGGPLQEQQMLTAEPFLQHLYTVLN